MSGPVLPWKTTRWFTATLLVCGLLCTTGAARAQTGAVGQSPPPAQSQDRTAGKAAKAAGKAAKADSKANTTRPGKAKDAQDQEKKMRSEPSVAYQESIRQTVERAAALAVPGERPRLEHPGPWAESSPGPCPLP